MNKQRVQELLGFYEKHLYERVLPFWLKNGIDREHGGYFTCFNNLGDKLVSTDKYVWSQGRMVWLFSKLAEFEAEDPQARKEYLKMARFGFEFLKDHCFLPNGNCAFLLDREGKPKEPVVGEGYDTSIFADCFVVLGFAKFAVESGNEEALKRGLELFQSILARIERNEYRTEPEPLPEGYRSHGISMILLNTSQELYHALTMFDHPAGAGIKAKCRSLVDDITTCFVTEDGILFELLNKAQKNEVCILDRYINPGHSLEDMWFIMHYTVEFGDKDCLKITEKVIEKMFALGWDDEFGGLFHFADQNGGRPKGEAGRFEDHPLVKKLKQDWDDKLWWVHAEALYSTLLCYFLTGNEKMYSLYQKVHDYAFSTFPNPNKKIGEWIQIRDREGRPESKVVALPVKDPFHIIRSLILIIQLLQRQL